MPIGTPFALKSTRATLPSLSDALAISRIEAGAKYGPAGDGAASVMVGAALLTTVTETGVDVPTRPRSSVALAVNA